MSILQVIGGHVLNRGQQEQNHIEDQDQDSLVAVNHVESIFKAEDGDCLGLLFVETVHVLLEVERV